MMRTIAAPFKFVFLATVVAVLSSGCAGVGLINWPREKVVEADAQNPAVEILTIWQPAEGQFEGRPTRGFAGQILFFTRRSNTPIRVNGDVRVYVFDDQGTPEEQSKPMHQFDFEGAAWNTHLRAGTFGPAYHIFIPYTRRSHFRSKCALRVRLRPANGPVIFSEIVSVTLPGPTREPEEESQTLANRPRDVDQRENHEADERLEKAFAKLNDSRGRKPPRKFTADRRRRIAQPSLDVEQLDRELLEEDRPDDPYVRQVSATYESEEESELEARLRRLEALLGNSIDSSAPRRRPRRITRDRQDESTARRFRIAPTKRVEKSRQVRPRIIDLRDEEDRFFDTQPSDEPDVLEVATELHSEDLPSLPLAAEMESKPKRRLKQLKRLRLAHRNLELSPTNRTVSRRRPESIHRTTSDVEFYEPKQSFKPTRSFHRLPIQDASSQSEEDESNYLPPLRRREIRQKEKGKNSKGRLECEPES